MTNKTSKVQFVKIDLGPLLNRVQRYADSNQKIKVWVRGESPLSLTFSLHKNTFQFDKDKISESWLDQEVLFSLNYEGIPYFFKGKQSELKDAIKLCFDLDSEVFKVERRDKERLLSFPHMKVYAYFTISSDQLENPTNSDNILEFNQNRREEVDFFKSFIKKKDSMILGDKLLDDDQHLIGFRVLDISEVGMALVVNKIEKEIFSIDQIFDGKVLFKDKLVKIAKIEKIYVVDYINPNFESVSMYKVGVKFQENHALKEIISEYITEGEFSRLQKEFENINDD